MKDQKFTRFEELLIAFENEDKKCEGKVHADDIRKVGVMEVMEGQRSLFQIDVKF